MTVEDMVYCNELNSTVELNTGTLLVDIAIGQYTICSKSSA